MKILVTGGAGYIGAVLVPKLLDEGYDVVVLDLYIYGDDVLNPVKNHPRLDQVKGDLRDRALLERITPGCDVVIHLACISNDPSFELNPELGKSINYDAFSPFVEICARSGVKRFIHASSSSVYGIKSVENVDETMSLEPLTDYSKYKAMCEEILLRYQSADFTTTILRPATVCGYSPRQRLDVIVNILTNHAVNTGKIKIFGGGQKRPNIHIQDMVDVYSLILKLPPEMIAGGIFNVGFENHTVNQLGEMVRGIVGEKVDIEVVPTNDNRSYHISSEKITKELGFRPRSTIQDAIRDLVKAFSDHLLPDSMNASRYFNIKRMREIDLK